MKLLIFGEMLAILIGCLTCLCPRSATGQRQYSGPDSVSPAYYFRHFGLVYDGVIGGKLIRIRLLPGESAEIEGIYFGRDLSEHVITGKITGPRDLLLAELDSVKDTAATIRLHFSEYDTLSTLRGFKLQREVIVGTYQTGSTTVPVRLVGYRFIRNGERREDKLEAETMIQKMIAAILKDDSLRVAELLKFPLRVNGLNQKKHSTKSSRIANRRELLRLYPRIFNMTMKRWIMADIPKELPYLYTNQSHDETGIMVACGALWFDVGGTLRTVNIMETDPPLAF